MMPSIARRHLSVVTSRHYQLYQFCQTLRCRAHGYMCVNFHHCIRIALAGIIVMRFHLYDQYHSLYHDLSHDKSVHLRSKQRKTHAQVQNSRQEDPRLGCCCADAFRSARGDGTLSVRWCHEWGMSGLYKSKSRRKYVYTGVLRQFGVVEVGLEPAVRGFAAASKPHFLRNK